MAVSLWEVAYFSVEVKVPLTPKKLEQEYSPHVIKEHFLAHLEISVDF